MYILYFGALIPILIGLGLMFTGREVHWLEWLLGATFAFITAGAFHFFSIRVQIGDYETISGSIVQVRQFSEWREKYEEAIYRTQSYYTGSGKHRTRHTRRVFSHYESRTRTHPVNWRAYSNINTDYNINFDTYAYLRDKFGGDGPVPGKRYTSEHHSKMIGGDPNDYVAINKTGWIEPINEWNYFENRVRATRNIFNFVKISDKDEKKWLESGELFKYPYHENSWHSNRLLGTANKVIKPFDWEVINAKLGPVKFVNLVCVGYDTSDREIADKQIAYWFGGKKNDILIFFGPGWSKVYSWSDSELCKMNIQTLFLNPSDPQLLTKLNDEIRKNYTLVDWHKFDYLGIQPTWAHIIWYFIILIITQAILYIIFYNNNLYH